jgi:DNA gyrase subunit B
MSLSLKKEIEPKKARYSEKDISFFKTELEKIRAKPQMYIGPTDDHGIFSILREAMDNSVDEARAGRNKSLIIILDKDSYWVIDEGVCIPVKKHPEAKISTLTHVLTALQASGKMKGEAYKSAIGTHGVGLKCTNALSKSFEVWTHRKDADGWYNTKFEKGKEKSSVKKSKAPKLPKPFKTPKLGTVIKFSPDETIFLKAKLVLEQLKKWCEITSYMNPGLEIQLLDTKGKLKKWKSKDGIKDYLNKRLEALEANPMNAKPCAYSSSTMEFAVSFADVEGSQMEFFTNTVRNVDEGVHADAFYKALFEALKPFKKGKMDFTQKDLTDGLVGIFNYKINAPQFSSQTKEKLVDGRVYDPCLKECTEALVEYFKKNKTLAKDLMRRASELRKKTAEFLKSKKLIKNVNAAKKKLPAKLADVDGKCPIEKRELYLVEGDSAGGTAKRARHKAFQAVFSLKGKPLNVMDAKIDKVAASAEVANILAGIGINIDKLDSGVTARYGKIIFLTDPDVDGFHINTLLFALLWKFVPSFFKNNMIYVVKSPEYMARYKGKIYFGSSKDSVYKKAGSKNIDIQHIKGWGEINDTDLRPIAFDIATRKLIRVKPPKDKHGIEEFEALMGKSPLFRKKLLGVA